MESLHIRCLWRGGGVALIQTKYYRSPQPRGCGGARAMRPEQTKQIIRCKGVLTVEVESISLRKSPTFLSTTEHWSPR